MDWIPDFYEQQNLLLARTAEVGDQHHEKVAIIARALRTDRKLRILELGAGMGENAAAAAELGHEVVAVELVERVADQATELAESHDSLTVVQGDFYEIDFGAPFDLVVYWDGFGVGTDADQRRLLTRIAGALRPSGSALIDVYNPLYAARTVGRTMTLGEVQRRYGFDPEGCRWMDTFWRTGREGEAVTQILRCYTPADLRLLLQGTGLRLDRLESQGTWDWDAKVWHPKADLHTAIWYTAHLVPDSNQSR